jgi:p-hydroxybenzoate 3-monooxygenase
MRAPIGIVGAGPAGLVIAYLLQRVGIAYVLLEREAEVGAQPRAGVLEYRTVELLRREGIADGVVAFTAENHECEFRTPHDSVVLDYGRLTGGRPHFIRAQHEVVRDLYSGLGSDHVRCGHIVEQVVPSQHGVRLLIARPNGSREELDCELVIGCEGSHGPVAAAMTGLSIMEQQYAVRLLAAIAAAPPLEQRTIYAAHPRGYAGQMRRTPTHTRYYLEVPASDTATDWPAQRIRSELATRLGVGERLDGVAFDEVGFLDLRVRMADSLQQGRIFLAGDAAHLITPFGGKGMNLAIQDAVELAHGIIEYAGGDRNRLDAYSATRLPHIWRTQAFSNWFLRMILAHGGDAFSTGLRGAWVGALRDDPMLARWFAHAYAGVDP